MIDRIDVLVGVEALRGVCSLDSAKLARMALEHNATLMRVASEIRQMASGPQPYLSMLSAADVMERVAKAQPGELRIDLGVLSDAADALERLADEPPMEFPNRRTRRARAAQK